MNSDARSRTCPAIHAGLDFPVLSFNETDPPLPDCRGAHGNMDSLELLPRRDGSMVRNFPLHWRSRTLASAVAACVSWGNGGRQLFGRSCAQQ